MLGNLVYDFIVELFGRHGDRSWTWIFDFIIVGSKCITTRSSQHFSVSATTLSKPMSPPNFTFYPTTSHHYKIKNMSKQFPVISSPSQYHQPIPSHPKPTVESSIANPAESWFYRGHEGANRTGDQERDLAAIKLQNFQTFPNNLFPNNFQSFPIIFQSFPVCLNMSRLFSIIRIPNLSSGILSRKLIL